MTERWTDKKPGFTGSVPPGLGGLSMKRYLKEQGGLFVTKMSQVEPDGSVSIIKGHGMYVKTIWEPTPTTAVVGLSCELPSDRPNLLIFYRDGEDAKVAYLSFVEEQVEDGLPVGTPVLTESCTVASLGIENFTDKVFCHSKRFMHNVQMLDGSIVNRELYLVAMSFELTPLGSYSGWANFVSANPDFALVTNTEEIPITNSAQVFKDLTDINNQVNGTHAYEPDGGLDNWKILGTGEAGDCEDFALTKADLLLKRGYPASAIRLAAGETEAGLGHAWLVVQTTEGEYALDINYTTLQCDESLPYTKRQRQTGTLWKSMSIFDSFRDAVYAGYDLDRRQPKVWWYIYDPLINKFSKIFSAVQDLPYTRDIRDGMDSVMGAVEWSQVLFPLRGGVSRDTLNACNFSENENTIYVSQLSGSWPAAYALNYEEKSVGGIFGQTQTEARYYNGIWFINRVGDVVERALSSGVHATVKNLHTGAEVTPLAYYDGIQIAALEGYFNARLYQHTEPTIFTGIADTLPTNGTWVTTLVTGTPPPDPPDWQATLNGIAYENIRGLFPVDFVEDPFRLKYIYSMNSHKAGDYTGMYSWNVSHTMYPPEEGGIDLGSIGGTTNVFPEQARKRALALCYAQGKVEKITGLLITTAMTRTDLITESTKKIYRNGISLENEISTAAGVGVENILGLVYAPVKEAA
jgi:predicted transglutaminase-like cysteine proteinase